ncbi:protein NETWORKED 4B [Senna tora]|uniref:Protein NETWORKED 4B n=1 Tax=Senna tora TaxID=362788 RepID=A0A834T9B0_9FABA|nr:protein NETWORKED 4B [Senna tora]
MEGSDNSEAVYDQGTLGTTPYYTPYQKEVLQLQTSDLQPINMDLSPIFGSDSSVASPKEAPRSPSSSSSSESESSNSSVIHHLPVNTDDSELPIDTKLKEEFPDMEQQNHKVLEDNIDDMLQTRENGSYEELLRKFIKNEEELRVSNLNLQMSEKEISNLKSRVEKKLKMREADLEYERGRVLELQKQIADLGTHVPDCDYKISKLMEEMELTREQLKVSNDEIARLQDELVSSTCDGTNDLQAQLEVGQEKIATLETQLDSGRKQIQELEDRVIWYKANEAKNELEVQNLKDEMLDAQAQILLEKNQLLSDIESLSEEKLQMNSRLKELELESHFLQNELKEREAEKLILEEMHVFELNALEGEVSSLKEELGQRTYDIESLNKEFDKHKQKYDMLMTEKDGANATIHKLMAEVSFRNDQIENKERELQQLQVQQAELISGSETRLNLVNELKQKVEELKEEVARQNGVISDRAEEKREAIRQLCFSIEHYRSGYQELLQAFTGHKRHAVIAS